MSRCGQNLLSSIPSEKDMVDLPPSAIRHFYDKLLKLKINAYTNRIQLAEERHQFMKLFYLNFIASGTRRIKK